MTPPAPEAPGDPSPPATARRPPSSVVVVGLGLIGGSAALRLRARGVGVTAIDSPEVLALPAAVAASDRRIDRADQLAVAEALEDATVLLTAPPLAVERWLPRALDTARLVTDAASTKRHLVRAVAGHPRRGRYVPGHPMAGAELGGVERAHGDLFEGRAWLLCPEQADADALDTVETLVTLLGARVQYLDAATHDRAVATVSHLPRLLASALLAQADDQGAVAAAGPAFADMTRVAGGPEALWQEIFTLNHDELAEALQQMVRLLERLESGLRRGETDGAVALLRRAGKARLRAESTGRRG